MESMVSDEAIKKVLLICDEGYVERADSRQGGVGTEAQIISAKVYRDVGQDKFAAVVVSLNERGEPLLPTYMSTRLYFDMSSLEAEATNFERIVRWIFDEPFHALPPVGAKPDFLAKTYSTGSSLFRLREAAANSPRVGSGSDPEAILHAIGEEAQAFHLQLIDESNPAEKVYASIKETRPVSENAYHAIRQLTANANDRAADILHSFFELLMLSWDYIPINTRYTRYDGDVYQYFVHDLFVSFVSIAMTQRNFEFAAEILSMPLFKPKPHDKTGEAVDYVEFRPYAESLEKLGRERRRVSLHADLLNEGHEHSIVTQTAFMEADLTLHLRGIIAPKLSWFPISGIFLSGTYGALPTYVRAKSTKFYSRLKPLLLNVEADALRAQLAEMTNTGQGLRFDYRTFNVARLIAVSEIATAA